MFAHRKPPVVNGSGGLVIKLNLVGINDLFHLNNAIFFLPKQSIVWKIRDGQYCSGGDING